MTGFIELNNAFEGRFSQQIKTQDNKSSPIELGIEIVRTKKYRQSEKYPYDK